MAPLFCHHIQEMKINPDDVKEARYSTPTRGGTYIKFFDGRVVEDAEVVSEFISDCDPNWNKKQAICLRAIQPK